MLLAAKEELVDNTTALDSTAVVSPATGCDTEGHATDDGTVERTVVRNVSEIAIDGHVDVAAIFAKFKGKVVDRAYRSEVESNICVVGEEALDQCRRPGSSFQP